jgi:glycosyltransferase involved in cell wall biosynthesis
MNLDPAYDSPMRVCLGCRTTVTFYDLIPLKVYWSVWPQASKDAYLMRLCHLKNGRGQILAISEFTRKDLITALEFPAHRVDVVMAGLHPTVRTGQIDPDEVRRVKEKYGIEKPFFLHVGAVDSHKNFVSVLKAMPLMRWAEDVQLVVAGKVESQLKSMSQFTGRLRAGTLVSPGFVPRADLEILYREAIALLFLSVYEGFGLPVLEAMANSCPVITTTATSIPEVAGDAAILCEPFDIEGVSRRSRCRPRSHRRRARRTRAPTAWSSRPERTVRL